MPASADGYTATCQITAVVGNEEKEWAQKVTGREAGEGWLLLSVLCYLEPLLLHLLFNRELALQRGLEQEMQELELCDGLPKGTVPRHQGSAMGRFQAVSGCLGVGCRMKGKQMSEQARNSFKS